MISKNPYRGKCDTKFCVDPLEHGCWKPATTTLGGRYMCEECANYCAYAENDDYIRELWGYPYVLWTWLKGILGKS